MSDKGILKGLENRSGGKLILVVNSCKDKECWFTMDFIVKCAFVTSEYFVTRTEIKFI